MARFSKIIDQLDNDIKKMSYNDVCYALSSCDTEDKLSFEVEAENMGMSFVENAVDKKLGEYYGPKLIFKNDIGETVKVPDIANINSDHIDYWTKRANKTSNPLLKMRYTGLVWDLCKRITGKEPSFKDIKLQFIISSIETVEQDLADNPICGLNYIEYAIYKAIGINNVKLTDRAINTMLTYEAKYSKDRYPGMWGRAFQMLIDHIAQFSSYEDGMLKSILERFERFEVACNDGHKAVDNIHLLQDNAKLLADYYLQKHNTVKVKEYLDRYHICLTLLYDTQKATWSQGMIQNLQRLYRKYNMTKEANHLNLEVQALGSRVQEEMKSLEISVAIENDKIDDYFKPLLEGTANEVLTKYMFKYLINLDDERKMQKEYAEQNPLMDKIMTVAYNQAGMPINNIGVGEYAEEQKLAYGMYRRMLISSCFIKMHIQKMKLKEMFTYDMVMNLFQDSLLILESQRPLLARGMKAYFDKDYIVTCHLLVPLFEKTIRVLAESNGHEVIRPNADPQEGNEYVSLDRLLNYIENDDASLKNVVAYFKNIFTDKYGWNTRNLLCHGALPASSFNDTLADRVVHAFLFLSLFKPINKEDDGTNVPE